MSDERPRVLVCDDDPEITSLIAQALEEDGFATAEVHDGRTLVAAYGAVRPALVITDQRMPGWTGLEVLAGLREANLGTPLILITAFGDAFVHEEARRLGVIAVFDKPFDLSALREKVRELAGGAA